LTRAARALLGFDGDLPSLRLGSFILAYRCSTTRNSGLKQRIRISLARVCPHIQLVIEQADSGGRLRPSYKNTNRDLDNRNHEPRTMPESSPRLFWSRRTQNR